MFKRLFWLVTGASFGFGMSLWVNRLVKRTIERYAPRRVRRDLAGALSAFAVEVRAAVAEGRDAMREQESSLRSQLGPAGRPGGPG
jgi:hypothetical protein